MGCFIIAEAGVNHNGSAELAVQLVEVAAAAGADAVKFQTFKAEELAAPGAEKAAYQRDQTGEGDQFTMLRQLELTEAMHERIFARCRELGIVFMSTPFSPAAADYLQALGMTRIKIPSGELTNLPFLAHLAAFDRPMILSTGMGTLAEIAEAVDTIRAARAQRGLGADLAERLTLLHCTSNYPAANEDVNLRAMRTMADAFGLPVGYSDHTAGTVIAVAAVALGACVIEKHFTLDRNLPGPDHQASLEPDELARLIRDVRAVEAALGTGEKAPRPSELPVRDLVRKSVTLTRAVAAGEVLRAEDLALLRPGTGIPPKELASVIGRQAARDLAIHATLQWGDLQA